MKHKLFSFHLLVSLCFSVIIFSCTDAEDPIVDLEARTILDESYGSGIENAMDIFLPAGRSKTKTPLFVYIHGGSWISGDKNEILVFKPLIENSFPDYAIITINYSLLNIETGSGKFPAQEIDIIDAINYIVTKTDDWEVSKEIILAGASAGGHLALLHAYKHQEIGDIKAVMALFPPTDLTSLFNFNTITQQGLQVLLDGTPENQPDAYAESSPLTFVTANTIPTVFFHGTSDTVVPVSQSEKLAEKLEKYNVNYLFEAIPGEGHGLEFGPYAQVIQKAADFIKAEL